MSTDREFADFLKSLPRTRSVAETEARIRKHDHEHWTPQELSYGKAPLVPAGHH